MIYQAVAKLPFRVLYLLSDIAAFLLYHIARYRRSISYHNLHRSFPDKSTKEIMQIQKSAYLHLTDSFLEELKTKTITDQEISARIDLKNLDGLEKLFNSDKSVFLLTAHTAPIDWVAFALHLKFGCIIDPVYKPIHSNMLDRFIYAARSRHQGTPIPYKKLAKDVILRKHVKRSIAMLADLEPRSRDQTLEVDFLNQSTRFFLGSERIIKLTKLPTYFIGIRQVRRGYYQAYAKEISSRPSDLEAEELTRKYIQCVEKIILENPAAWLWTHKRWKHRTI